MKITTYNAASVRARMPRLLEWLEENEPDVIAIQETKVEDHLFPREEFEALGYELAIHGQKSYNGVAILSRLPMQNVRTGFGDELWPTDCRIISAEIEGITVLNTYVPNGNTVGSEKWSYKMAWLERFRDLVTSHLRRNDRLIWLGDINIAPDPIDVYDSKKVFGGVGHHPEEFSRLAAIRDLGLTEMYRALYPEKQEFTYWEFTIPKAQDRGVGWRIDHLYASAPLRDQFTSVVIDYEARRKEKPSDHTFVSADVTL